MWFSARDGQWADERAGAERAHRLFDTQREAIDSARETLRNEGGGELVIHGEDGKFREKDTVPPAPDHFPPPG